jgi:hypothetical protein
MKPLLRLFIVWGILLSGMLLFPFVALPAQKDFRWQNLADAYKDIYAIAGTVNDDSGDALSGVTVSDGEGNVATTGDDGNYSINDLPAGTYTITPTLEGYTFEPPNRTVTIPPDATAQDFTAYAFGEVFLVDRDGFHFSNFSYYGSDWEDFKRAFPATQMDLPDGSRRKGPQRYFESKLYRNVGEGGNCAGFTAVSLIRFLNLTEGVETDLLQPEHRDISPLYEMPNPGKGPFNQGESDIADYIHLYQARQLSAQYHNWWFAQGHAEETPQNVFDGIREYTERNEPVAVDIFVVRVVDNTEKIFGHRMTAYRTEQNDDMGYIFVYDNNWPDDKTRRIEIDLTTGRWSYELSTSQTWQGMENIRYSPASLNFPAALPGRYDKDSMLSSEDTARGIFLGVEGDANLLIRDDQGNKLGFENGQLVSTIPDAGYLPALAFNPDTPDSSMSGSFYVPESTRYDLDVSPTSSGSYTLTAFANGTAMSLDNIPTTLGNNDSVTLNDGVRDVTFAPAKETEYCYYVTLEASEEASRDYMSCMTSAGETSFNLDQSNGDLTIGNTGDEDLQVEVEIDEVGASASNETVDMTVAAGEKMLLHKDEDDGEWTSEPVVDVKNVYIPLVQR